MVYLAHVRLIGVLYAQLADDRGDTQWYKPCAPFSAQAAALSK